MTAKPKRAGITIRLDEELHRDLSHMLIDLGVMSNDYFVNYIKEQVAAYKNEQLLKYKKVLEEEKPL